MKLVSVVFITEYTAIHIVFNFAELVHMYPLGMQIRDP